MGADSEADRSRKKPKVNRSAADRSRQLKPTGAEPLLYSVIRSAENGYYFVLAS
jgi:hypothetical protein